MFFELIACFLFFEARKSRVRHSSSFSDNISGEDIVVFAMSNTIAIGVLVFSRAVLIAIVADSNDLQVSAFDLAASKNFFTPDLEYRL